LNSKTIVALNWEIADPTWHDTLVQSKLNVDPASIPAEYDTEQTVPLVLIPKQRPAITTDVKVRE
jgi:hypothetical protein